MALGTMHRHLKALLWKNKLIKQRNPCLFGCELLFASVATSWLVAVRSLVGDAGVIQVDEGNHVEDALPVTLPECAEYIDDCEADLVEGSRYCIKGRTYGCLSKHGRQGVWVNFGCSGTFDLSGGMRIACNSSSLPRFPEGFEKDECFNDNDDGLSPIRPSWDEDGRGARRLQGAEMSALQSVLSFWQEDAGKHRYKAGFAVAPAQWAVPFKEWLEKQGHPWAEHVRPFADNDAMQDFIQDEHYPSRDATKNETSLLCGAVVFETEPTAEVVKYSLRFNLSLGDQAVGPVPKVMKPVIQTDSLYDASGQDFMKLGGFATTGLKWYATSGFLSMQRTVDAFIEQGNGQWQPPAIRGIIGEDGRPHLVVPFPTPAKQQNRLLLAPHLLDLFLLVSLTLSVWILITSVVEEREMKLREGMRMMGLNPAAFYLSWLLTYAAMSVVIAAGVSFFLSVGGVLPNSSTSLLFCWILLFAFASNNFGLVISTLFSKARTAAVVGSLLFFFSTFLHHLVSPSGWSKLLCLLPTVAYVLGAQVLQVTEAEGIGAVWGNLGYQVPLGVRNFSLKESCVLLAYDAVMYLFLYLYLDQVVPHEIGVQRPWNFLFTSSFWAEICGGGSEKSGSRNLRTSLSARGGNDHDPEESCVALVERDVGEAASMMSRNGQTVELKRLCKTFAEVQAVQALDLIMYQGEIFALLGHNGAGKTTTLAMLCGLVKPSSGTCTIFGCDLVEDATNAQQLLGVCPQHDVLWRELSASEHLQLFGGFKGVSERDLPAEVELMLQRVRLFGEDAEREASNLSGGMKRKLSLGIAFIGGSRLVLLDEPTSGLDPYSRRMVWELLRGMKPGRVTVMSTHYMDEADILGDRIAILHQGCLRCCGSSNFLKRAYGCGYNITLVQREGCNAHVVENALLGMLPGGVSGTDIRILSNSGRELIFQLPFNAAQHFPHILRGLENRLEELQLESYGISVTTLEEVFLKVASGETLAANQAPAAQQNQQQGNRNGFNDTSEADVYVGYESPLSARGRNYSYGNMLGDHEGGGRGAGRHRRGKFKTCRTHLSALFLKRVRYGMRDWKACMCQLVVPILLLIFCLSVISYRQFRNMPPMVLAAAEYNEECGSNTVPYSYLHKSVDQDEARDLLQHGLPFWRGKPETLQQFDPDTQVKLTWFEHKLLTSSTQSLFEEARRQVEHPGSLDPKWNLDDPLAQGLMRAANVLNSSTVSTIAQLRIKEFEDWLLKTGILTGGGAQSRRRLPETEEDEQERDEEAHQEEAEEVVARAAASPEVAAKAADSIFAFAVDLMLQTWAAATNARHWERRLEQLIPSTDASSWSLATALLSSPDEFAYKVMAQMWASGDGNSGMESTLARRLEEGGGGRNVTTLAANSDKAQQANLSTGAKRKNGTENRWPLTGARCLSFGEQKLWDVVDTDRDGRLNKTEVSTILTQVIRKGAQGPLPLHLRPAEVAAILADAMLAAFNVGGEDAITEAQACQVSEAVHASYLRLSSLGEVFSNQLLNSTSACSRFGGYYMLPDAHAIIFANATSSHSAAAYQAAFTNTRFQKRGSPNDARRKKVEVSVHPFPRSNREEKSLESHTTFKLGSYVCFSMAFIPAGVIQFIVKERSSGARQLQVQSGASAASYWFATFAYDMGLYILQALCVPVALHVYGFDMLLVGESGKAVAVVLVAFGPAITGFTYTFSFLFKDHSKASYSVLAFCLIGSTIMSLILFILFILNFDFLREYPMACDRPTAASPNGDCAFPNVRMAERVLSPLFRLVPSVAFYQAIFAIATMAFVHQQISEELLQSLLPHLHLSPFSEEFAGGPIKFLIAEACTFLLVAIVADWCIHSPQIERLMDPTNVNRKLDEAMAALKIKMGSADVRSPPLIAAAPTSSSGGDESVMEEKERVLAMAVDNAALHVHALEKEYSKWASRTPPKHAVRGVSFCVHYGEVFGLLGHNGAGKTSALKCIVGEQCATTGGIHVGGFDMGTDTARARRQVGYCPQFDALLELLTVRDHLDLFASLRGLTAQDIRQAEVDFGLSPIMHRRADFLSGGNKRKLSAAIALLGRPSLSVLDEPSCGLDPRARRSLWDAVQSVVRGAAANGSSSRTATSAVLLTTHSMEEAEALSTRLGIMAGGDMLTIGTAQQIKQRHGASHEISLTLRPEKPSQISLLLQKLGGGPSTPMGPETRLSPASIQALLKANPSKLAAFQRPRCVIRTQLEALKYVEAAVLVEWWCQQDRGEGIFNFLKRRHREEKDAAHAALVEITENVGALWRFRLPADCLSLPDLFETLETESERLSIQEYTITQASLEQIFNNIARDAHQ